MCLASYEMINLARCGQETIIEKRFGQIWVMGSSQKWQRNSSSMRFHPALAVFLRTDIILIFVVGWAATKFIIFMGLFDAFRSARRLNMSFRPAAFDMKHGSIGHTSPTGISGQRPTMLSIPGIWSICCGVILSSFRHRIPGEMSFSGANTSLKNSTKQCILFFNLYFC